MLGYVQDLSHLTPEQREKVERKRAEKLAKKKAKEQKKGKSGIGLGEGCAKVGLWGRGNERKN